MNTPRVRILATPTIALALVILVCGCGGSSGKEASPNAPATITVGFDSPQAYTNNMPVLIAIDQGFFKRRGLTVKTVGFSGGSDAVKALVGGSIDVQAGVAFDVVAAQAHSLSVKGFFGEAQKSDFAFFANPDSGVGSLSNLGGKTVAISAFGSYTDYLTKQIAKHDGLSSTSVKEVPLGTTAAIVGAVTSNRVAGTWEPASLAGLFGSKARNVGTASSLVPASQYSTLLATSSYISGHTGVLTRFVAAVSEAIKWQATHRAQTIKLAIAQLKVPAAVATAGYVTAKPLYTPNGNMSEGGFASMAQAVPSLKLGSSVPATSGLYTSQFVLK